MRARTCVLASLVLLFGACGGGDGPIASGARKTEPTTIPDTTEATAPDTTSGPPEATIPSVAPWTLPDAPDLPTLPPVSPSGPACEAIAGGRIAFDQQPVDTDVTTDERWAVSVVGPDGTAPIPLLDANALGYQYLGQPAWSPNGTRLALSAITEGGGQHLVVATCDGVIEVSLDNLEMRTASYPLPIESPSYPAWSPDGRLLAFASADGLYVVDPGNVEQPYRIEFPLDVARGRPAWSPEGTQIAVGIEIDDQAEVVVVPVTGGPVVTLTSDAAADFQPAWSPDGTTLAFQSERGGAERIWLMDADGGNQRPLTAEGIDAYQPAWSPDGTQVVYVSQVGEGDTRLRVIALDGTGDRLLLPEDSTLHWEGWPSWTP